MSEIRRSDARATAVQRLIADDSGQDLIEYVMLTAMLAMAAIACMNGLVNNIGNLFNALENYM